MIDIGPLQAEERGPWERLFRGYMDFYGRDPPGSMYERAWEAFQADREMHALGARIEGRLVGIAHFLVHPNTSAADVCYLQDLFTAEEARGRGVARALIEAVAARARARGCSRVYWTTQDSNAVARRLYDQVAENRGFIRYQIELT